MDVAGKVLAEMLKILEDQFMELDGRNISLLLKDAPRDVQNYQSAGHSTFYGIAEPRAYKDCYLHRSGEVGQHLDDGRDRYAGACPKPGTSAQINL